MQVQRSMEVIIKQSLKNLTLKVFEEEQTLKLLPQMTSPPSAIIMAQTPMTFHESENDSYNKNSRSKEDLF